MNKKRDSKQDDGDEKRPRTEDDPAPTRPRREWLSPVGPRHPRIGNSFQVTDLPSPGSFEESKTETEKQ